jgi:hypothetical protein
MKRIILIFSMAMVGLLLPAVVSPISAQLDRPLTAKIPFSFTVCREQLPAGKYTIQHATTSSPHTLVVRGEDGRSVDLACTTNIESAKAVTGGKLIFNRYGDQYFLWQAWWPGDNIGHELVQTDKEKAVIKEFTGSAKKPEKVTIKIVK